MENDINATASRAGVVKLGPSQVNLRLDSFTLALFIVFIVGCISLYLVRPTVSGESVTVRCERSAVIAAGDKVNFRKERKLAFERCMDESLQTKTQPPVALSGNTKHLERIISPHDSFGLVNVGSAVGLPYDGAEVISTSKRHPTLAEISTFSESPRSLPNRIESEHLSLQVRPQNGFTQIYDPLKLPALMLHSKKTLSNL